MAGDGSTKREIEIKLRIAGLLAILPKLRNLGAVSHGRVFEQNTLYDIPAFEIRGSGRLLRLRIDTPAQAAWSHAGRRSMILTFKGPSIRLARGAEPPYKERSEREVIVQKTQQWPRALRSPGLRPTFRYDKYRTSFRLADLHLDLDETPVGVFLELEGPPAAIDRTARSLGFSRQDYLRQSYWELYVVDCRHRGRVPSNMLFHHKKSN